MGLGLLQRGCSECKKGRSPYRKSKAPAPFLFCLRFPRICDAESPVSENVKTRKLGFREHLF